MNDTEKLIWFDQEMERRAELAESLGYIIDRITWEVIGRRK